MRRRPEIKSGKILLTNSQKVKNDGLSENAFGFIFALGAERRGGLGNAQAGAFGAVRPTRPAKSLQGAHDARSVGLGGAGTEIGRLAHEFGMTVIATRASSHEGPPFVEYVGLANELPDLIGRADIVVIAAPLRHRAGCQRRDVLEDEAQSDAGQLLAGGDRRARRLGGGAAGRAGRQRRHGLGIRKPLPADSPLWKSPNLMLTGSRETPRSNRPTGRAPANPIVQRDEELRWVLVRENMRRFAAGEKMYSVFDRSADMSSRLRR